MKTKNPALLVIDVQKAIDAPYWGTRNNLQMESNIARLLDAWRSRGLTVMFIRHDYQDPESEYRPNHAGNDFKDGLQPLKSETIVPKKVTSGFIGTDLEKLLHSEGIEEVIATGVITNNSIEATVRVGANLGFSMITIADGTSTFERRGWNGEEFDAETVHSMALSNLDGEYGRVASTDQILNEINHIKLVEPTETSSATH